MGPKARAAGAGSRGLHGVTSTGWARTAVLALRNGSSCSASAGGSKLQPAMKRVACTEVWLQGVYGWLAAAVGGPSPSR